MWFNNWKNDLIKLGFAKLGHSTGEVEIPEKQLGIILSLDESCLSLDGASGAAGTNTNLACDFLSKKYSCTNLLNIK